MIDKTQLLHWLRNERRFLRNVIKDFKPEHADFRPKPEMMSVGQQIHHIAHTVHWFHEGGFGAGFEMDFEKFMAEDRKPWTLEAALAELDKSYDAFLAGLERESDARLGETLPPNPILGEVPRAAVVNACTDHTAHHRGSLAVYLRLLGLTPAMPYMD